MSRRVGHSLNRSNNAQRCHSPSRGRKHRGPSLHQLNASLAKTGGNSNAPRERETTRRKGNSSIEPAGRVSGFLKRIKATAEQLRLWELSHFSEDRITTHDFQVDRGLG